MNSKKVFKFAIFLFCAINLSQCTNDQLEVVTTECTDDIAYTTSVKPIIDETCAYVDCHDGGPSAPGDYSTYRGMVSFLTEDLFVDRTIIVRDMPPNYADGQTSLTSEQLNILNCWIENGYKN
jgi:hypothetical protein